MSAQILQLDIRQLKALPPLPQTSQRILAMINNPAVDIDRLAALLEECPALTARLIGLANSAYFGRAGKIHTLKDAIIQALGLSLVKSITLACLLAENLDCRHCPAFKAEKYWLNALLTAHLGQQLARAMATQQRPPADIAYTSGLLTQLGILALVHSKPDRMQEILAAAEGDRVSVAQLLRTHLGTDQYQVGKWLIIHWQLPEIYAEVISAQSLSNRKLRQTQILAQLVALARQLAAALLKSDSAIPYPSLAQDLAIDSDKLQKIIEKNSKKQEELLALARQFE